MEPSPFRKQMIALIMPEIIAASPDRSAELVTDLVAGLAFSIVATSRGNKELINSLSEGLSYHLVEMIAEISADFERFKSRHAGGR